MVSLLGFVNWWRHIALLASSSTTVDTLPKRLTVKWFQRLVKILEGMEPMHVCSNIHIRSQVLAQPQLHAGTTCTGRWYVCLLC